MRRLDRVLGRKAEQPVAERASFPQPWQWAFPYGTDPKKSDPMSPEFPSYVEGGLKGNGAVFALIRFRQAVFSECRFQFQRFADGRPGELFGTPDLAILERPWPGGTTGDMLARMELDASLAGNSYWLREDDELVHLRPDWVKIVLEGRGDRLPPKLAGYLYFDGGEYNGGDPLPIPAEAMCHYAPMPDPLARYKGMSWLTPVARNILADSQMTDHKSAFMDNAAIPGLTVSLKEGLSPEQFNEFVDAMDRTHKGPGNAGKTLYLANGADVSVVGANFGEMNLTGVQSATQTQLANAAGVPVTIAGFSEGLAGSSLNAGNYQAAKRNFADGTMRNLWRNMAGSMEMLVKPPPGSRLWYDERDVAFLRDDMKDRAEIAAMDAQLMRTLTDAGFEPASIQLALSSDYDWTLLKHSGLYSVQLQPPGTGEAPPTAPRSLEIVRDRFGEVVEIVEGGQDAH